MTDDAPFGFFASRENHYRLAYDGVAWVPRSSAAQRYTARPGRCRRRVYDFRTECVIAAEEIARTATGDVWLGLSGSIASEVMATAFVHAGVNACAAILRLPYDANFHQICWAINFCHNKQLAYEVFDFDYLAFLKSPDCLHVARQAQTHDIRRLAICQLMDWVAAQGGVPILAGPLPTLRTVAQVWHVQESEAATALWRYSFARKQAAVPNFFRWRPEQLLAYLRHPVLRPLLRGQRDGVSSSVSWEPAVLATYWSLAPRPAYNGFERITIEETALSAVLQPQLATDILPPVGMDARPVAELLDNLEPDTSRAPSHPHDL